MAAEDDAALTASFNLIKDKTMAEFVTGRKAFVSTCLGEQYNASSMDFGIFQNKGPTCFAQAAEASTEMRKTVGAVGGLPQSSLDILDVGDRAILCFKTALNGAVDLGDFGSKIAQCEA